MSIDEIRLTSTQIGDMKHAIGGKVCKSPYRNYFNTRDPNKSWDEIVKFGLATRRDTDKQLGGTYYHLTDKGIDFLKSIEK